jgi:ubiquinone/menaquinone biosynthesis C-methylase UbiE
MGDGVDRETERVRRIWEKIAGDYDRSISFMERLIFAGGREWVCSQVEGDVLEIAVGTGRNFPFYPRGVRLTGVDFSPAMLEIARSRAAEAGMDVELRKGDAQALDFADASFDSVVCTLSLCSIPDDHRAVAEVKRVLRPGGRFLLMEHVRSPVLAVRIGEYLVNWFSVRFQGDHMLREPLEHLRAFGFMVERLERRKLGLVELVAARKPQGRKLASTSG